MQFLRKVITIVLFVAIMVGGWSFAAENGGVHLIGHSYGARVAARAAAELDPVPRQLTMFDAPENVMTYMSGSQAGMHQTLRELA